MLKTKENMMNKLILIEEMIEQTAEDRDLMNKLLQFLEKSQEPIEQK